MSPFHPGTSPMQSNEAPENGPTWGHNIQHPGHRSGCRKTKIPATLISVVAQKTQMWRFFCWKFLQIGQKTNRVKLISNPQWAPLGTTIMFPKQESKALNLHQYQWHNEGSMKLNETFKTSSPQIPTKFQRHVGSIQNSKVSWHSGYCDWFHKKVTIQACYNAHILA